MPEIVAPKQVEKENFIEFAGSFGCHSCDEFCWEAKFYPAKQKLVWECVNGHVSEIDYAYG